MAANAGAIRAGRAYVEVSTEESGFNAGLRRMQEKLKGWSESLKHLGERTRGGELPEPLSAIARFIASPAGIFTAMTEIARHFAETGDQMSRMADMAGTSVEAISALAYAAKMTDVNVESLATGLKKMQQAIYQAARGGAAGVEASQALGMNLAEIAKLPAEQQFSRIAEALSKISNPAQRTAAAVAVFGRNGAELLPLLLKGASGVDAFIARAKELGLVMSTETAEKASQLDDAFKELVMVTSGVARAIGAELAGSVRSAVEWITRIGVAVKNWIHDHRGLAVVIFGSVAAITALGTALTIGGVLIGAMTTGLSAIGVALAAVGTVISAVAAVIASPFLLIGAAIAGVIGYVLYATGTFEKLGKWFASTFAADIGIAKEAWDAITEALASGDLGAAMSVAVAFLKVEWARGVAWLESKWQDFVDVFKNAWSSAVAWLLDKWESISSVITHGIIWVENQVGILSDDEARQQHKSVDQDSAARRRAINDRLGEERRKYDEAHAEALKRIEGEKSAAMDAWKSVLAERKKAAEKHESEHQKAMGDIGDITASRMESTGTFSSSSLWGIGGGPVQQIADNTAATNRAAERIANNTENINRLTALTFK
jgi:hypothetical protein